MYRQDSLDENEMRELFSREKPELVLDATHPYAAEVTRNIRKACEEAEVSYTRILRTGSGQQNAVLCQGCTGSSRAPERNRQEMFS